MHRLHKDSFVPVRAENDRCFFGGNQEWFERRKQVYGGCGPTAAATIFHYMFCGSKPISRREFLQIMNSVYGSIRPMEIPFVQFSLGYFSLHGFARNFKRWYQSQTVAPATCAISPHIIPFRTKKCKESAIQSMKDALNQDSPVALLTMFVGKNPIMTLCANHDRKQKYDKHWVTVTRMENEPGGRCLIYVSSWGEEYCIDFDAYWENINWTHLFLPSGMVWFQRLG